MPRLDLEFRVSFGNFRIEGTEDGMLVRVRTERELPFTYWILNDEEFGGATGVGALTSPVYGMYSHIMLAHNDKRNVFALVQCVGKPHTKLPDGWDIIWEPDPENPDDQRRFTRDVFGKKYDKWERK